MTPRALLAALCLALSLPLQAATEVIPLNYRTAEDVMPVVQSVIGNEGRVSAYGNQLIVNASPQKIQELRGVLDKLDTAPRRLLISVDTSDSNYQDDRGYSVNGSASVGGVDVQAGRGEVNGRDQVRIIRRSTDSRGGGVQQVQATEGYPALIQVGQSVPITSASTGPYGQVYTNTEYRNVTRGFYVTASVTGQTVHVSLSSNRDRLSQSQPGAIDIQSTDTRVSGRLGEWITVGGVNESSQSDNSGFLHRQTTQGSENMALRLKVDSLD
ncbi:secretin [Pseudomonas otitidis]|uniref:secretin N-terminal domain-containing protein n=1 Tax=Metapseudomonas otitidis TaxID=319939 RepID=UPI00244CAF16|nr:secretin N-terminal domain-containing protein [Pseudomonas otitidis]MDH1105802.1 secretin [Pseudomonas otitidis]MDH1156949.1 secretin [Pseudomonas otitidis]MDH1162253.1 secretin [Pseudomonas otitidis]